MVSLTRIVRDYEEAGSLNSLLGLWGFVDETTFLTKAGHVGVVYRVRGIDHEGLTHGQRQVLTHRFEAGVRLLDEHCRLSQYLVKRTIEPIVAARCDHPLAHDAIQRRTAYLNGRRHELYELSLFWVLLYEAPHVIRRSTSLDQLWARSAPGIAAMAVGRPHTGRSRIGTESRDRHPSPEGHGLRGAGE